jgi:MFS family permease
MRPLRASLGPQRPAAVSVDTHLLDFRPVLRNRAALGYILAYAAHMWELFGVRSWLVVFLTFSLTLNSPAAGYWHPTSVVALTGLVAMWASVAGNELAVRFGRVRVLTGIMGASALAAFAVGFSAPLPYPLVSALCVLYAMLVQGDSAALHNGTVQSAAAHRRGATMAVQSLVGFSSAFLGPLVVGVVLDATGGGATVASWAAAFAAMGTVVALGPIALRRLAGAGTVTHL